ncbi:MAG: ATP-binding protein [Spirochaetes bacterium]|nr:ATP-binding protein [Spirochaetota bacterium]
MSEKTIKTDKGRLKIGDNWNAISIIALSQNNPLKAIAEFVENSIDAKACNITIIRGKEKGQYYLKIIDDGEGIPKDPDGIPDFKYVATHICDSAKKRLKKEGIQGLQGEFGIGLLSFWTVGEMLFMTSSGDDGRNYCMTMNRNKPGYSINARKALFVNKGTELLIKPILPGIKQLNGEKIQNYLASELRDRIKKTNVKIKIIDRTSRNEYEVIPRQFSGRLLHNLSLLSSKYGDIYLELYLNEYSTGNEIGLYRQGTRVLKSVAILDEFNCEPWTSGYFQGLMDVPYLQLTPGTRDGLIRDSLYESFINSIEKVSIELKSIIEEEKKKEEEKASRNVLKTIQKALKEAFLMLPREEYDWLEIYMPQSLKKSGLKFTGYKREVTGSAQGAESIPENYHEQGASVADKTGQMHFFEFPGPLYKVIISPTSCIINIGLAKNFRAIARDKNKRVIDKNIIFKWDIVEGGGKIENDETEIAAYHAPNEPGITIIKVTAAQNERVCSSESIITITDSIMPKSQTEGLDQKKGLPDYTFKYAPGDLWRSNYDQENNLIVINNGHADYIFSSKNKIRKLRYICKLYSKELVLKNFIGLSANDILERMVELSIYAEENLK